MRLPPHTTNVPAEKNPINNESPAIPHGIAPPAEKKFFIVFPDLEKRIPVQMIPKAKKEMVI